MIIVGLTGAIGHGKTTFAEMLSSHASGARHFETWELVSEVAYGLRNEQPSHPDPEDIEAINRWLIPLPDIVARSVHASLDYRDIRLDAETMAQHPEYYDKLIEYLKLVKNDPSLSDCDITADNKAELRSILQWLGGFLVLKIGSGVWYDELLRRVTAAPSNGINLVTVGGVRYPGDAERLRNAGGVIIQIQRPEMPEHDRADMTERERDLIQPDATVINDGSLEHLEQCAVHIYRDLVQRDLAPSYICNGDTAVQST